MSKDSKFILAAQDIIDPRFKKIIETQQSKIASFEERIKLIEDLLK
jgi:hypothetical protein